MRQDRADTNQPTAQPVVAAAPQTDDEPNVIRVGAALCIRLSLLPHLRFAHVQVNPYP